MTVVADHTDQMKPGWRGPVGINQWVEHLKHRHHDIYTTVSQKKNVVSNLLR